MELGVDYGFSLFALASPRIGEVYGVVTFSELGRFYNALELPRAYLSHSHGLGLVSQNAALLQEILAAFPERRRGDI